MADLRKFKKMLELLVNENKEAAQELFHEIVVEKSRNIYESLLESDDEFSSEDDDYIKEFDEEDEDEFDWDNIDDDFEDPRDVTEEDDEDFGGDPTDDMLDDLESTDDDEELSDGDIEDRVVDLEDALDDLKMEFEKLMSDEESEDDFDSNDDEESEDDMEDDFDSNDDEESEDDMEESAYSDEDEDEDEKSPSEQMREYVEKIGGETYNKFGKMGDNGVNTKSPVAKKNNMGGSSSNIVPSTVEKGVEANKGKLKGSAVNSQTPKEMNTKNINVPGGKAGKTAFKNREPGHGAERKGRETTADKSTTSTLNKVSSRAK